MKSVTIAAAAAAGLIVGAVSALPVSGIVAISLTVAVLVFAWQRYRRYQKNRTITTLLDHVVDLIGDYAGSLPGSMSAVDQKKFRYDLEMAKRLLNQIAGLAPENPVALHYTAMYYLLLGNHIDAERLSGKAEKICPGNALVLNGRGLVCHRNGDRRQALAYFEKALQADPADPMPRKNITFLQSETPRRLLKHL